MNFVAFFSRIDLIGPPEAAYSRPFSQTSKTKKTKVVKAECDWNMGRQRPQCFKSQNIWFKERSVPGTMYWWFADFSLFWDMCHTIHMTLVPFGEWFDLGHRRFSSMAWRRWWRCRVNAGSARHVGSGRPAMAWKKNVKLAGLTRKCRWLDSIDFGVHLCGFRLDFDFPSHACLEGFFFWLNKPSA